MYERNYVISKIPKNFKKNLKLKNGEFKENVHIESVVKGLK